MINKDTNSTTPTFNGYNSNSPRMAYWSRNPKRFDHATEHLWSLIMWPLKVIIANSYPKMLTAQLYCTSVMQRCSQVNVYIYIAQNHKENNKTCLSKVCILTFSPSAVWIDNMDKPEWCFFTPLMLDAGITTCNMWTNKEAGQQALILVAFTALKRTLQSYFSIVSQCDLKHGWLR